MTPDRTTYDRADAAILSVLMGAHSPAEGTMKEGEGLTWTQITYRPICAALIVGGLAMASCSHFAPWGWLQIVAKDLGAGLLISGILASFVEPFFRMEFARDAFLDAFRRVLPDEFKDEVEKIIRFEFIADEQVWSVGIEKIPNTEVVGVTTSFERRATNKSKSNRYINCDYEV